MKPRIEDVLVDLFESELQAEFDFCGEQREWHLPRLNRAAVAMMQLFPEDAARAMGRTKTPHGEFVLERE